MSWFSNWLKSDSVKSILKLAERILKLIIGRVAEDVQRIAYEEVKIAEASGKDGLDKYEAVFKAMKKRFPSIKDSALNYAIEAAVLALQSS